MLMIDNQWAFHFYLIIDMIYKVNELRIRIFFFELKHFEKQKKKVLMSISTKTLLSNHIKQEPFHSYDINVIFWNIQIKVREKKYVELFLFVYVTKSNCNRIMVLKKN